MQSTTNGVCIYERKCEDFIACIPHEIEADWHEKWGPLLAGFPVNIVYACVQRAESDQSKMLGITACYEPALGTFRETEKTRELTYFNREGGSYRVANSSYTERAVGWKLSNTRVKN